jgi:hypothetical protein
MGSRRRGWVGRCGWRGGMGCIRVAVLRTRGERSCEHAGRD